MSQISERDITPGTSTTAICPLKMAVFVSGSEFCGWPLLWKVSAQLLTDETLQLGRVPDYLSVSTNSHKSFSLALWVLFFIYKIARLAVPGLLCFSGSDG